MKTSKKVICFFILLSSLIWVGHLFGIAPSILKQKQELLRELTERKTYLAQHPADPDAHFELAMAMAYTGYLEEGWNELLKVNDLDKEYAPKVIKKFGAIVEQEPDNWKARFRLAFGYYFDGYLNKEQELVQKNKAIEQFEKILEKYPDNIWAYNYLGYVYADKGNIPRAIAIWKKSISLDPTVAATHFVLGHAYLRTGRYVDGVSEVGLALRLKTLGR
jgi:tetratricopeptide (TPR) repeat protein